MAVKAKAAPATAKRAAVKLDPDALTIKTRDPAYTLDPRAPRVEVSPGTYVTSGVRVNGSTPSLVFVDGSRQTGLPMAVVNVAILGGVISDGTIDALHALRAQK